MTGKRPHRIQVEFEEAPDDICNNMTSLGWNIEKWEKQGKWALIDTDRVCDPYILQPQEYTTVTYLQTARGANCFSNAQGDPDWL